MRAFASLLVVYATIMGLMFALDLLEMRWLATLVGVGLGAALGRYLPKWSAVWGSRSWGFYLFIALAAMFTVFGPNINDRVLGYLFVGATGASFLLSLAYFNLRTAKSA